MAGIEAEISPQVSAGLEYRYFATTTPSFADSPGGMSVEVDPDYHTHNILATLTWRFR